MKYFEYLTDRHSLDYAFRPVNKGDQRDVEVYALVFQDIDDYVALVPKATYDRSSDFSYGTTPLVLGVMAWCLPFMVHIDDLKTAFEGIINAIKSNEPYENPTTGVVLAGWKPSARAPKLFPTPAPECISGVNSEASIKRLWKDITGSADQTGVNVDLNPIAPLICDFILTTKEHAIRIEHKYTSRSNQWNLRTGTQSPFAPHRLWHFLIYQSGIGPSAEYLCIRRGEAHPEWANSATISADMMAAFHHFSGPRALLDLLSYIASDAGLAAQEAEAVLANASPDDIADPEVLSSGADLANIMVPDMESREMNALKGRIQHSKGLHWIFPQFDGQCRQDGDKIMISPLDLGAPHGNVAMVRTPQQDTVPNSGLDPDGRRYRFIFDKRLQKAACLVMRFEDHSGGDHQKGIHGKHLSPWAMREAYWNRPCRGREQHFWTLASCLPAKSARIFDGYLLLPSGLTKRFDIDKNVRREKLTGTSDQRCRDYFLQKNLGDYSLPEPKQLLSKKHNTRRDLQTPGDFLKTLVEPIRHMVKVGDGTMYRNVCELLLGKDASMSI